MRLGRLLLGWLAPALLCGVAVLQMTVTAQTPLSPWKLGGFGMYSSVDSVRARWIRAVLVTSAGELPISFDRLLEDRPELARRARAVRSLPDPVSLSAIGEELLQGPKGFVDCTPEALRQGEGRRTRIRAAFVRMRAPGPSRAFGCRRMVVAGLRLEIWRHRYESDTRRLIGEKLVEVDVVEVP
jgi:hypothetical protein